MSTAAVSAAFMAFALATQTPVAPCAPPAEVAVEMAPPSFDQILAAIESAKSAFTPLTKEDLAEAQQELAEAVQRLDARFQTAGDTAEDWRTYLKWEALQGALAQDEPDLSVLDTVYARFSGGHEGLGLAAFSDVRRRLRHYLEVARAIDQPELKDQYPQVLDLLAKYLTAYQNEPNPQNALLISQSLRWLQGAEQAPWLVDLVRRHYGYANLYVEVSGELLAAAMGRSVDEVTPVEDCILGTSIFGTGHAVGSVTAGPATSGQQAAIDLIMRTATATNTVGYNGPVRIYSTGVTNSASRKRLLISDAGFSSLPAASNAVTNTRINRIDAGGKRLIEALAWRRAGKQKSQAEQIAADHAEQRLNRRFDEESAEQLAEANADYQDKFRRPLVRRNLFPATLNFGTTDQALQITALEAPAASHLAAATAPPVLSGRLDLGIRVHETMVNNFAEGLLGGMIVDEEQLQRNITDLLGYLPERLKDKNSEEGEPLSITFPEEQPVSVAFTASGFALTIRGVAYTKGDRSYPGMNVTAAYQIQKADQGFRAIRQGELEIFPPGFSPEEGERLSAPEQTLRTILQRRFQQVFPTEIVPEPITPEDRWAKIGQLELHDWQATPGWMLMGWRRVASE